MTEVEEPREAFTTPSPSIIITGNDEASVERVESIKTQPQTKNSNGTMQKAYVVVSGMNAVTKGQAMGFLYSGGTAMGYLSEG